MTLFDLIRLGKYRLDICSFFNDILKLLVRKYDEERRSSRDRRLDGDPCEEIYEIMATGRIYSNI